MRRSLLHGGLAVALLAVALLAACSDKSQAPSPPAPSADPLAALHELEESRRKSTDFAALPASDRALGPDPYALRALPGPGPARYVALLRGRDALVLLDASLHERARLPAPASPTGLAVTASGEIYVSGEQSSSIAHYRLEGDVLLPQGPVPLPAALVASGLSLRDLALGPGRVLHAADAFRGRLLSIPLDSPDKLTVLPAGRGAFRVAVTASWIIVDALLEHRLSLFRLDAKGRPDTASPLHIVHDGPLWGLDAREDERGLWIAAGGVEDHPLDRRGGSFGYIDSFVFLYHLAPGKTQPERVSAVNVSAEGVVTPKVVLLRDEGGSPAAWVLGYGSDRLLDLRFSPGSPTPPAQRSRRALPGVNALLDAGLGRLIGASPLFDAFVQIDTRAPPEAEPALIPVSDPRSPSFPPSPAPEARLGEALFFTTLMAPWNRSEGPLSRFTCETCHFEGQVDGRTHHTGRDEVHATTKPLLGLFNNRPHFSRALDPDLTTVADAEFRVAGALSDHDPWFSATAREAAWLPLLGLGEPALTPLALRRALMLFLMSFTHRPNPAALGRTTFSPEERQGQQLFQRRCEPCHEARLIADDPGSKVPLASWEGLIFRREGPIVWARSDYKKTGVLPYVHERGARVPSLRRLYAKWPHFTNGSAKDLESLLSRARFGDGGEDAPFFHDGAPEGLSSLRDDERKALAAFLDLL